MERFGRHSWACAMLPGFFFGLMLVGISYEVDVSNFSVVSGLYLPGLILYEGCFGS